MKEPPLLQSSLCKFERASILFAAERYDEALAELEELKELVPKESPVYFLLGKVSLPIAASALYSTQPTSPSFSFLLPQVHNKLNNTHMALMHFSWAMDLDPKGANSQIKDALDPTINSRAAGQEENAGGAGGGGAGGGAVADAAAGMCFDVAIVVKIIAKG